MTVQDRTRLIGWLKFLLESPAALVVGDFFWIRDAGFCLGRVHSSLYQFKGAAYRLAQIFTGIPGRFGSWFFLD